MVGHNCISADIIIILQARIPRMMTYLYVAAVKYLHMMKQLKIATLAFAG